MKRVAGSSLIIVQYPKYPHNMTFKEFLDFEILTLFPLGMVIWCVYVYVGMIYFPGLAPGLARYWGSRTYVRTLYVLLSSAKPATSRPLFVFVTLRRLDVPNGTSTFHGSITPSKYIFVLNKKTSLFICVNVQLYSIPVGNFILITLG